VWLFFGLGYAIAPDFFASLVGAAVTKAGSYRIMADIGVMMLGIGIWYVYCALDDSRTCHGLVSAFLICAGMLIGRLLGMAASGSANSITILYVVLETLDSALLFLALRMKQGLVPAEATRAP
jgi:hypothetical protein